MTAESLLKLSGLLEWPVLLAAVILLLWVCLRELLPSARRQDSQGAAEQRLERWLTSPREAVCIAAIVGISVLTRTFWWDQAISAPWWFGQVTPLYVAEMLETGHFWRQWLDSLLHFQPVYVHQSAAMIPVATAFQVVLGPSIHLPVLVGAFWGVMAVVFAWLLGRAAHSKLFGLGFAALLSASPLHITWSRIGGIPIGAVAHVLAVLWCSYRAGTRRSMLWAAAAGVLTWISLYHYLGARVVFPLAFVALWAGLRTAGAQPLSIMRILGALALALVLLYVSARQTGTDEILWPKYPGYTGSKGESGIVEVFAENWESWAHQLRQAPNNYFLRYRSTASPAAGVGSGMRYGGLCFLPVAALGCIGLVSALLHVRRQYLWFLLTGAGLALPVLSVATARRFLVFDLGWCALASLGLIAVLRARLWRSVPTGLLAAFMATILLGLTAWSFASIVLLNAVLPRDHKPTIPFGESGFGDGLTCLRCLQAGHEWQTDIARDGFVVLFDTDVHREDRTCPGGLPLYGKLAALSAGFKGNFIEFYAVMQNFDREPPYNGQPLYGPSTDSASYLIQRIVDAAPATILWHFEQPTQWERWFAERLEAAGGVLRHFETPLSKTPGLQVRTAWDKRADAFAVIRRLAEAEQRDDVAMVTLHQRDVLKLITPPLRIAPGAWQSGAKQLEWVFGSWQDVTYARSNYRHPPFYSPAGLGVERSPSSGLESIHILTEVGNHVVYEVGGQKPPRLMQLFPSPVGIGCAVRADSEWWVVDPVAGVVRGPDDIDWLPDQPWIGIAVANGRLALASADQWIFVFDIAEQKEILHFPARVWPSRRTRFGECSLVVATSTWYATVDHLRSLLTVYERGGREVGVRRLDRVLSGEDVTSVGAVGSYLAVGSWGNIVRTFELDFETLRQ